jgi:8-oxo-dGTP pyrophosphatase MutT (NUDIX family)
LSINHFNVAAGILCDAEGRILIAERLGGGPFHGLWEFPGGKIGADETSAQALSRELAEELGIELLSVTGTATLLAVKGRRCAGCGESGSTLMSYCRRMYRWLRRSNSATDLLSAN